MTFEWVEKKKGTYFVDLKKGDVFCTEDDRYLVFMKTDEVLNEFGEYNAVALSDGTLTYFDSHDEVEKIEAKMVLS